MILAFGLMHDPGFTFMARVSVSTAHVFLLQIWNDLT